MRYFLVLLLLCAPLAAAEPVTLYMHVNGFQDMPTNTQPPQGEQRATSGIPGMSACYEVPGVTRIVAQQLHTWYGYGSPGLVLYDFEGDGKPRYTMTRGLAEDVLINTAEPSTLTLHVATDERPAIAPEAQVRVTVREGDDISIAQTAYNTGAIVAQATTDPVSLYPGTPDVDHANVGGRDVYTFEIPLGFEKDRIEQSQGFNIRIDLFQEVPCLDGQAFFADLQMYQDGGHLNHWGLDVSNPMVHIEYIRPHLVEDSLVVEARGGSPFGAYDIDPGLAFAVVDAAGNEVVDHFERFTPTDRCNFHNCHEDVDRFVTANWVANITQLPDGVYEGTVTGYNLQHTANATARFAFELGNDIRLCGTTAAGYGCTLATIHEESPAPALGILVAALALLASRRR